MKEIKFKPEQYKPVDLLENNPNPDQFILVCSGVVCPYCGEKSKLIDSKQIYGRSYGKIYCCKKCDAYVGVHEGTEISKGRLANKELRDWKKRAHSMFDPMWRQKMRLSNTSKHEAITLAYKWLSEALGIDSKFCHIGMMDIEQCKMVVKVCESYV